MKLTNILKLIPNFFVVEMIVNFLIDSVMLTGIRLNRTTYILYCEIILLSTTSIYFLNTYFIWNTIDF